MADYYTKMCFSVPCSEKQAAQFNALFELDGRKATDITLPECLLPVWDTTEQMMRSLTGEPAEDILLFGLSYSYHINDQFVIKGFEVALITVSAAVQSIIQPVDPILFEWSNDCSSPKTDAYGGGVCVITRDQIIFKTTQVMGEEILSDLKRRNTKDESPE